MVNLQPTYTTRPVAGADVFLGGGGGFSPYAAGALGLGGALLGGLLGGGGDDMSQAITGAGNVYQQYLQQGLTKLQQEEALGRGDISQYYQQALGFGEPYRAAGAGALQAYQGTLGLGGPGARASALESFRASPGYQYALQQGLQGVQRGMAARGLSGSGAEMRALQAAGQGLASQEYGQYQQRLAGLAGMGAGQAGQAAQAALGTGRGLAGLGEFYGGRAAGLYGTMGQAQAEAQMAAARAREQQRSQWGQMLGQGLGAAAGLIGL